MSTTEPLTLRLPGWLCQSFDLACAIVNERRGCRFDQFDMRSHERAFVKNVLARTQLAARGQVDLATDHMRA
jgi:hypothetical protein